MKNRRKQLFNDKNTQGKLLISLIALESILVITAIYFLYIKFNAAIESHMYRIHNTNTDMLMPEIFEQLAMVIGVFIIANIISLMIAHIIWTKSVNNIILIFLNRLDAIKSLNFSQHFLTKTNDHKIIKLLKRWQQYEHIRCEKIKVHINSINKDINSTDIIKNKDDIKEKLTKCRELLIDR
jgi:hypothetical protein